MASAASETLDIAAQKATLEHALDALDSELDTMRAPRVTVSPGSLVIERLTALLQRLRAWARHCSEPAQAGESAEALWRRLQEVEVKHEAVCGLLQRAKRESDEL